MRLARTRSLVLAVLVLSSSASRVASAYDRARCVASYEEGQRHRQRGRLRDAHESFTTCKRTCNDALATHCETWSSELLAELATVRLRVNDVRGAPLSDVTVSSDGHRLVDAISDEPLVMEPGEHVVRFERPGAAAVELTVVLGRGEHDREVRAVMHSLPPDHDDRPRAGDGTRTTQILGLVAGGAGIAGLLVGGILSIKGFIDRDDLRSTCGPHCPLLNKDAVASTWTAAGVTAGVGLVLLATGVVLILTSSSAPTRSAMGTFPARPSR